MYFIEQPGVYPLSTSRGSFVINGTRLMLCVVFAPVVDMYLFLPSAVCVLLSGPSPMPCFLSPAHAFPTRMCSDINMCSLGSEVCSGSD